MRPRALLFAAALVLAAPGAATAQALHDAIEARELICEFSEGWRRSLIADMVGVPRGVDLLLAFERLTPETGEVLSSRHPGRKPVRVAGTDLALHLIEPAGHSVRVTTLTGCARSKLKDGVERCVRFSARHAWHFDTDAHLDPDGSLERQPSGAASGFCEPWKVD